MDAAVRAADGRSPEEEEESTEAQVAGLHKRVAILKQAPYVDFGVWLWFGRRALKSQKFRVYMPLGDGTDGFVEGLSGRGAHAGVVHLGSAGLLREDDRKACGAVAQPLGSDLSGRGQGQSGKVGEDQA